MARIFKPIIFFVVVISLAIIIWLIDPSGKLLAFIAFYVRNFWGGSLIELVLLGIVVLGLMIWVGRLFSANAEKKRPNFFEETQTALRTILLPLGFEEREASGRSKYAKYSRGEFSVWLTLEMDAIHSVTASSRPEAADAQKTPKPDFTVECVDIRKADEFKSESIAKLNEWLVQKRVR